MRSLAELIVDEGVPADVALDEEADEQPEELLEDEGDEEGVVDVLRRDEEDVREVYEVEQQQELVPAQQHVAELQPLVPEKHWQLTHRGIDKDDKSIE